MFGFAKPHVWKLWLLHLELVDFRKQRWAVPAAGGRMCFKTMVFGCGSLTFGSLAATYEGKGKCAAGGGSNDS